MLYGMHVHVEVPDPARRIDIMGRMIPYVPLLLALSTSSPFWRSQCTGLKGYRLTAYDELPRTGMPELFRSMHDYDAYVSALVCSGAIPDATHVWWAIRPSDKYPTLELRATDCCTRLEDAVALAALYRCFVRHLYRRPSVNADLDQVDRAIAVENKWLAQRYGVQASFVSPAGPVSVTEMLEDLLDRIRGDADVLGCWNDVLHCRRIVSGGSSADTQLRVYAQAKATNDADGFYPVLRWIGDASFA
jgi:carboxylate-amine ligase